MTFKRILHASALALAFVFGAPIAAQADPITAAIVGFTALTGTAAAVATFVVNSVLYSAASFALGKISGALSGKNKAALQERQASVTQMSLGEVPREFVFGVLVTGGSLDDAFNWGGQYGTDYVTRCITLADHALDQLYSVIVDEQGYLYAGNGVQAGFSGALTLDFFNASAEGSAPPAYVIENSGGAWTADDRHVGQAHVWVTYRFDEKVWPQGHPTFKFELRGMRVYDPRRDPAFGYVGENPNTWEDRSTHLYDANAALVRYAFERGIYVEGHQGDPEYLLLGRGLSADEAPPERIIAAANLCAEAITEGGGGSNIRYKVGGVVRASDDFIAVEEMFAAAMAGVIVQREGGVEVEPGHAKAAVTTITDGDLVIGEPIGFSEFLPDTDGGRINTVIPRYISPAQGWRDHSGPVRRNLDDITEDGGPRETTLPLALVFEADQADRCAEIARRLARLERRATIVLPPEYAWLEEGDWLAWSSDLKHGGATVRYRIEGWSLDESWRMRLSLREIASSVYGVPDPIEDTAEPPPVPVPVDALTLPGASAQAITLAGETSVLPAIRFTWDTPVDGAMRAIRGEVRVLGDTDASPTRFEDLADGVGIATNGVSPDQVVQARLVPIGDPTRPVLPSAWFTLSTAAVTAGEVILPGGRPISEQFPEGVDLPTLVGGVRTQSRTLIREALERWNRARDAHLAAITREDRIEAMLVETRETLTVANEAAMALIEIVQQASIDMDSAQTEARELQASVFGGSIAALELTTGTLATDLSAETYQRTLAVSSLGGSIAAVASDVSTVATALSAETSTRNTQYSATQGTLAAYDSRITTAAGVGTANASAITTLGVNLATASGLITTLQSATATLDGKVNLLYGFALNSNGRVAGMYAANDGSVSTIDFEFDVFRVWSGSAAVPMFAIDGGGVYIAGNRVNTASIVSGAVTNGASSRTAGSVYASTATFVQNCALTTAGGRVRVDFSVNLFGSATAPVDVIGTVYRNGTLIWYGVIGRMNGEQRVYVGPLPGPDDWVDIPGGLNASACFFFIDGGPSAGSNDYHLYVECSSGAVEVTERNMALLELKR